MKRTPLNRKTPLKRGTKRMKRSPLSRTSGPSRTSRLKGVGDRRKRQRKSGEVFGPLADRVRGMPCAACGSPGPNEVHHVRSRGAGFKDRLPDGTGNCVSLCTACHRRGHQVGWTTFEREAGVDLRETARRNGERAMEEREDGLV